MPVTYNLIRTDGTLDNQIVEGATINDHGLWFDGFQKPSYGDRRANNLLHLLENFASEEDGGNPGNPPTSVITNPLTGQFWYNKTAGSMRVWNGASWVPVSSDIFTDGGPFSVLDGTASNQLTLTKNLGAPVIINNIASQNDFDDHVAGASNAHLATAIAFDDSFVPFAAADVQEALEDSQARLDTHLVTSGAHDAVDIFFDDTGSISSDDVQNALEEVEGDVNTLVGNVTTAASNLSNHIADPTDAHDASAISYDNATSGLPASFDVQVALEELNNAVGGTSDQSVIDSMLAIRSGAQGGISSGVATKIGFNSVSFGDDLAQFNTVNNRYTASFDQTVRVRIAMGINSISDENRLELQIRKNGTIERRVEEWKWPESADPPGDIECSCILELDDGDYIEGWFVRYGGGTVSVDTLSTRTQFQVDVIMAREDPPPISDVRIRNQSVTSSAIDPLTATASITVNSNGDITGTNIVSPGFLSDEWHVSNPSGGIGSTFQARMVPLSGTLDIGTLNTWQTLSSSRTYGITQSSVGVKNFQGRLEIRDTGTLTIQDTADFDLTATVTISK